MTEPHIPLRWVFTRNDLMELLDAIRGCVEVSYDLETTGLNEHAYTGGPTNGGVAARVSMAQLTLPQPGDDPMDSPPMTWLVPLSHPYSPWLGNWAGVLNRIAAHIVRHRKPVIGQHIKFDCKWTEATTGVSLARLVGWDTMVGSHILDENEPTGLKHRASTIFGVDRWDDFDLSTPAASERVDLWDLGEYGGRDTYWTWRLACYQRDLMNVTNPVEPSTPEEEALDSLGRLAVEVAMPTIASLSLIEERGIGLDVEWIKPLLDEHRETVTKGLDGLAALYPEIEGKPTVAATANWFKAMTQAAVEDNALEVISITDSGAPQWNKAALKRNIKRGHDLVAPLILDVRGSVKKAEYLQSYLDNVALDGAIHTTYHSGRVMTGRLSSSDPNMQQVTKVLKPAFVPRPGYVIAEIDYSQIELRVAAFISRCEPMLAAYQRGDDLHRLFAAAMAKVKPEAVTDEQRQRAKAGNFGLLYGMSAAGFMIYAEDVYDVTLTLEEAEEVRDAFFEMWTGMAEWHKSVIDRAHFTGEVYSPIGRVRRVPAIWSGNPKDVSHAERQALNAPVQGFASDLMQIAAASIQGVLPGTAAVEGARLVGTVHDSIVAEVLLDGWEDIVRECQHRMKNLHQHLEPLGCHLDVPLAAEAKVGSRWGLSDIGVLV